MASDSFEPIIEEYRLRLKKSPHYAELHYQLALFLIYQNFYEQAMSEIKSCLELSPKYKLAQQLRKEIEYLLVHRDQSPFERETPPVLYAEVFQLAAIYSAKLKRIDTAREYLARASAIHHNEALEYLELGLVLEASGDIVKAQEYFEKSIELNVESWKPYYFLCHIYTLQDRLGDALNILKEGTEKYPAYADFRYNLALLQMESGLFEEAQLQLKKAIEINPYFIYAHYHLGAVYLLLGDSLKAEMEFNRTLQLGLYHNMVYLDLARAQLMNAKLMEAEENARKSIDLDPGNPEAYRIMGDIYQELGDLEKSTQYYNEAQSREEYHSPASTP